MGGGGGTTIIPGGGGGGGLRGFAGSALGRIGLGGAAAGIGLSAVEGFAGGEAGLAQTRNIFRQAVAAADAGGFDLEQDRAAIAAATSGLTDQQIYQILLQAYAGPIGETLAPALPEITSFAERRQRAFPGVSPDIVTELPREIATFGLGQLEDLGLTEAAISEPLARENVQRRLGRRVEEADTGLVQEEFARLAIAEIRRQLQTLPEEDPALRVAREAQTAAQSAIQQGALAGIPGQDFVGAVTREGYFPATAVTAARPGIDRPSFLPTGPGVASREIPGSSGAPDRRPKPLTPSPPSARRLGARPVASSTPTWRSTNWRDCRASAAACPSTTSPPRRPRQLARAWSDNLRPALSAVSARAWWSAPSGRSRRLSRTV